MAYKKASKIKRLILMFTNIQNFLENTCNKLAPRLNLRTRLMLWGLYITQTDSVTVVYIRTLVIRDNICTLFWITVILGTFTIHIHYHWLCTVMCSSAFDHHHFLSFFTCDSYSMLNNFSIWKSIWEQTRDKYLVFWTLHWLSKYKSVTCIRNFYSGAI